MKKRIFIYIAAIMLGTVLLAGTQTNDVQAGKVVKISKGSQLKNLAKKSKGYGPGKTYRITKSFTLGDGDNSTCMLPKGKYTIDFYGHTVMNTRANQPVFTIRGANVTFKDSKAKKKNACILSYGGGAIGVEKGKLTIVNGRYYGRSNGVTNPYALGLTGGTVVVKNGFFHADATYTVINGGGKLQIKNGEFRNTSWVTFNHMAGSTKITKGTFVAGTTPAGLQLAIVAYSPQNAFNLNKLLAKGSKYKTSFTPAYWNGNAMLYAQPSYLTVYTATYGAQKIVVGK